MDNSVTQPQRKLILDGGINFRDLGGYRSDNGKTVVWKKLWRCGHLSNLSQADLDSIKQLNITQIHDLRREAEQSLYPTTIPNALQNADYQMTFGSMGVFSEYAAKGELTADIARNLMSDLYAKALITTQAPLGLLLKNIVADNPPALIFHCMAGKDRTGVAAAALLMALGVDETDIIEDYLLTQVHGELDLITEYVVKGLAQKGVTQVDRDALAPYCSVEEQYIVRFLEQMKQLYGNSETYLSQGLGMTAAELVTLKDRFLE